jgi:2-aminoadipate transaminase
VIYVGTFSKPFATGARVGFGVLPEPVCTAVERIKGNHDFGTSSLLQHLLAAALDSGRYDRHLAGLRQRYRHKAGVMTTAARRHFPARVAWSEPQGGLYLWARLPRTVAAGVRSRFFRAALERGVLYVPGQLCYAPDPRRPRPRQELRLSFGGASPDQITRGMARLGQVLGEMA